jgi:outer membrane protein TolC
MKKIVLLALGLGLFASAQAQLSKTDTAIILRLEREPSIVERFKAQLVHLALSHPDVKQHGIRRQINKYETNMASALWLNHFTASGNLNEFTIKGNRNNTGNNPNIATFYPRYNFGVTLPLGNLIRIPNEIKKTKAERGVIEAQEESLKREMKALVLQVYEEYIANKRLYELNMPMLEDALLIFQQSEERFKEGDESMPLELYKETSRKYNEQLTRSVILERDYKQSKLKLEGIVGMTLEEVLASL